MEEEKNVDVPKEEVSEKKVAQKSKRLKVLIILLVTIVFSFFVFGVARFILFGDSMHKTQNNIPNNTVNVHRFSGEILYSQIIGNYSFVTEYIPTGENVGNINVNFLYRNRLVSNIIVAENINIKDCFDYGIVFRDYNNDGMSDFSHIFSRENNSSVYKIYTLTKEGKIVLLDDKEYIFSSNKFSPALYVKDGTYTYNESKVYYDGYEIGIDVGTYKLEGERKTEYKKVNDRSKLSFEDNHSIEIPKYDVKTSLTDEFLEKHSLLKRYNEVQVINIDLDSDKDNEKIVYLFDNETSNTRIIMFDSDDDVIATLINVKGKKYELNDVIEFMDIDNDGTIEIITKKPDLNEIVISKYYLGYYFPKVEFN